MRKTYQGSCHCGRLAFEVEADIDHVRVCDCSICRRRGALYFRLGANDAFRLTTPIENAATYQFHTRTATDYFCPVCGVLPFRHPRIAPETWMINVRCLEGIDLDALPVTHIQGSRIA